MSGPARINIWGIGSRCVAATTIVFRMDTTSRMFGCWWNHVGVQAFSAACCLTFIGHCFATHWITDLTGDTADSTTRDRSMLKQTDGIKYGGFKPRG